MEKTIIVVNLSYENGSHYKTIYEVPNDKVQQSVEAIKNAKRMWDEFPKDERGTIESLIENNFEELNIKYNCDGYVNIDLVFDC